MPATANVDNAPATIFLLVFGSKALFEKLPSFVLISLKIDFLSVGGKSLVTLSMSTSTIASFSCCNFSFANLNCSFISVLSLSILVASSYTSIFWSAFKTRAYLITLVADKSPIPYASKFICFSTHVLCALYTTFPLTLCMIFTASLSLESGSLMSRTDSASLHSSSTCLKLPLLRDRNSW